MFDFLKNVYAFAKKYVLPLIFAIVGLYFVRFIVFVIRMAGWRGGGLYIVEDLFYTFLMMSAYAVGAIALIKKNEKLFRAFFVIVFSALFFDSIAYVFNFIRYFGGGDAVSVINAILTSLCAVAVLLVGILTVFNYVKGEKKYGEIIDVAVAVYVVLKTISFVLMLIVGIVNGNFGAENVNLLTNVLQAFLFIAIYDGVSGRLDGLPLKKEKVSESAKQSGDAESEEVGETAKDSATEESATEQAEEPVTEEATKETEKEETDGEAGEEEKDGSSEDVAEEKADAEKPKKEKRGLFSRKK